MLRYDKRILHKEDPADHHYYRMKAHVSIDRQARPFGRTTMAI